MDAAINSELLNLALALISLLAAAATYGVTKLTKRAKAETAKIQDDSLRDKLDDAIDDMDELVTKTVAATEQTAAKDLRAAVKAGTAKKEDLIALSQKALEEITEQIAPEAQELIAEHFGSFEDYLVKCIETKVLQIKATEE